MMKLIERRTDHAAVPIVVDRQPFLRRDAVAWQVERYEPPPAAEPFEDRMGTEARLYELSGCAETTPFVDWLASRSIGRYVR